MKIPDVIRLKQEQHVHNEKEVLTEVTHPFIIRLWVPPPPSSSPSLLTPSRGEEEAGNLDVRVWGFSAKHEHIDWSHLAFSQVLICLRWWVWVRKRAESCPPAQLLLFQQQLSPAEALGCLYGSRWTSARRCPSCVSSAWSYRQEKKTTVIVIQVLLGKGGKALNSSLEIKSERRNESIIISVASSQHLWKTEEPPPSSSVPALPSFYACEKLPSWYSCRTLL